MKRIYLLILLLVIIAGCSYYKIQVMPANFYSAETIEQKNLVVGKQVEVSDYGFRLFTIPISMPDPMVITQDMIAKNEALGITDLQVQFNEFGGPGSAPTYWGYVLSLLFQIPKVTVQGQLVYKTKPAP